ncbi:hypothetical protein [Aquisalinus flavus]|nr:hypothetical protein [Aquisalinus flavus]MBD0426646.1 hypothetical protein [Aquisalinus flavus]UNE47812.1 hypothetical protein FF099_06985 [Aquisalinus flavus]
MEQLPPEMMLLAQGVTAVLWAIIVFALSFVWFRPEHRGGKPWLTHLGALIFGFLFGGFIGLVMVPLGQAVTEGRIEMYSTDYLKWYLPALVVLILMLRTDVTVRLPLLGAPIRAYRSALLRRQIAQAQKRLAKMEGMGAGRGQQD